MQTFKMYELAGKSDACRKRRNFEYAIKSSAAEYYKKACAIKAAVSKLLIDGMSEEDVEAELKEAFEGIDYSNEMQRNLHEADAWRQIMRFVKSENRPISKAPATDILVKPGMMVRVNPDYFVIQGETIEVIKLKTSKPNLTQAQAYNSLELYALLKYARALVPAGKSCLLKASIYFLRKANDSASLEKPVFDADFFLEKGGRNIISIMEEYKFGTAETDMDKRFEPIADAFSEGLDEEECTADDCAHCDLHDICKYAEPPIAIVKAPVVRSVKDIELTEAQEAAVEYEKGVVRINAGAGAGKTMAIAIRTATLLNKGFKPEEICLVTFTNAGAEEMRTRIAMYCEDFGIEEDLSKMTICTFNAFGDEIIKEEYAKLGFAEPPTVIDDIERSHIIADLLNAKTISGLDYRNFTSNNRNCKGALAMTRRIFDIIKAKQLGLGDEQEILKALEYDRRFCNTTAITQLLEMYRDYDAKLIDENLIEFSDQQAMVFDILRKDPFYFEKFGFKHIIVDEFQDSDKGQIEIVKRLRACPTFESLMVVGDDSQAIFGFRDTSPEFILNFEKYMGEKVDDIYLLENHRSTPEIIEFANRVNARNVNRVAKDLIATRPHGKPVVAMGFHSKKEEQTYVIDGIKDHLDKGFKPEDIAVICATKQELQEMAGLLQEENIPSVMLNPEPLLENSRVQAAIAFMNVLQDPEDTKDLLIYANAKIGGGVLGMSEEEIEALTNDAMSAVLEFRNKYSDTDKKDYLMTILEELDHNDDEVYQSFLKTLKGKRIEKVFEYANDFFKYGSGATFRRTHDYPGVVLTTAHSSKGLEWPVVYDMISKYHTEDIDVHSGEAVLRKEEKRRLLFVSATRARDELYITGQYIAYGKTGNYTLNTFLKDSYECSEPPKEFDATTIFAEKELIREAEKQKRAEERKKKKDEEKAKKEEAEFLEIFNMAG